MTADHPSLWLSRSERPARHGAGAPLPASTEVLVVGAGLTGLCTALLLGRAGVPTVLVEARTVGEGTTGRSTAKLSLLQGSVLSRMRRHAGGDAVSAYVAGNSRGQSWLLDELRDGGVPVERRDAVTYAVSTAGADRVHDEAAAARAAGLAVVDHDDAGMPFPTTAAIRLADQAQFDPVQVLDHLRDQVVAAGVTLVEGTRVVGMSWGRPYAVSTSAGEIVAARVVLATQTPVLDRSLHFAGLRAQRSYALAYRVPEEGSGAPAEMCLSVDDETRSLRTASHPGSEALVVGGGDHEVGREESPARRVAELEAWARQHFTVGERLASWSAQDYVPVGGVPSVGAVPGTDGGLLVATGYAKWGMASAPMAAHVIAGALLGAEPAWAAPMRRHVPGVRDLAEATAFSASVGGRLVGDRVALASGSGAPDTPPAEGHGRVEGGPLRPTGVSTVDGRSCRVSAVCPHLGGVLAWNDAERSWDCPLHGSRFTADGTLIEGPATGDLDRLSL